MILPTISLWQPWASLIRFDHKRYETRTWPTNVRGRVAIHAAKKWNRELRDDAAYFEGAFSLPDEALTMAPRGAIVCVADLVSCEQMTTALIQDVGELERMVGGWHESRFAWRLENVVALVKPLPFRGRQGFFTAEVPDHLIRRADDKCLCCGMDRGFHGPVLAAPGLPQCVSFVEFPHKEARES